MGEEKVERPQFIEEPITGPGWISEINLNHYPFRIVVEWHCQKCGKLVTLSPMYGFPGQEYPRGWPPMPPGWTECRQRYYCEDHKVKVEVE